MVNDVVRNPGASTNGYCGSPVAAQTDSCLQHLTQIIKVVLVLVFFSKSWRRSGKRRGHTWMNDTSTCCRPSPMRWDSSDQRSTMPYSKEHRYGSAVVDPGFLGGANYKGGGGNLLFRPFLPAATKLGQGNVFTGVCLSTGGVCLSACWDARPPRTRHTTPWEQTPPGADPPRSRPSPGPGTPPPLGIRRPHMVNERPVRILLECILVFIKSAWKWKRVDRGPSQRSEWESRQSVGNRCWIVKIGCHFVILIKIFGTSVKLRTHY